MTTPNTPPNKFVSVLFSATAYGPAPSVAKEGVAEPVETPWTLIEPVNVSSAYDNGTDVIFVLTQPVPLVLAEPSARGTIDVLTAGTSCTVQSGLTVLELDAAGNVSRVRVVDVVTSGATRASVAALDLGW